MPRTWEYWLAHNHVDGVPYWYWQAILAKNEAQ